ncbi:hypothetical protein THAOC_14655 [Thalassiosira oceanica]|uniref:Glutathionylspermidine synthase pre-ATP-grasp-like domain-containing protein n=1 Tax=Thalassiosira oceanica TaxID=159749 RepID=K0SGU1_THAOC|nr:hypothetical protein THAOC_14655 [Thalassiosira oceanica]|eukprot:EJK64595.1 hypothetical protein THAOC_14655 [Thalassiosira oceanica]
MLLSPPRTPALVSFARLLSTRPPPKSPTHHEPRFYLLKLGASAAGLVGAAVLLDAFVIGPAMEKRAADAEPGLKTHLERLHMTARSDWADRLAEVGFTFAILPGIFWSRNWYPAGWGKTDPYWNEDAAYKVSAQGMGMIERAAFELHSMCLEAVAEVVESNELLREFGIPDELWPAVRHSWRTRQSDLCGRLDLLWDGEGPPKLAEYNADTPTREATRKGFLSVVTAQRATEDLPFEEERATAMRVYQCAREAGVSCSFMDIEEFGLHDVRENLLRAAEPFALGPDIAIWKLYPYEWMVEETLGEALQPPYLEGRVRLLEPPWKLIMSSKAILAHLWKRHPGHPNLLPAYNSAEELEAFVASADGPDFVGGAEDVGMHWVSKPRLGREGHGIEYSNCEVKQFRTLADFTQSGIAAALSSSEVAHDPVADGSAAPKAGRDGAVTAVLRDLIGGDVVNKTAVKGLLDHAWGGTHVKGSSHLNGGALRLNVGRPVFQQYHSPARLHGRTVITSAWVVRGMPAAACFREDTAKTTNNDSCFVPHFVERHGVATITEHEAYPLTEEQAKLRAQLYGSDPALPSPKTLLDPPVPYHRGGFLRSGYSPTGGGGARSKPEPHSGGESWWRGKQPKKQQHAGPPPGSSVNGSPEATPRSAPRGKPGSVGATGKPDSGYTRAKRAIGSTGRAASRWGGGGRG